MLVSSKMNKNRKFLPSSSNLDLVEKWTISTFLSAVLSLKNGQNCTVKQSQLRTHFQPTLKSTKVASN